MSLLQYNKRTCLFCILPQSSAECVWGCAMHSSVYILVQCQHALINNFCEGMTIPLYWPIKMVEDQHQEETREKMLAGDPAGVGPLEHSSF